MAGETYLLEVTFDNPNNDNFQPNTIAVQDSTNSTNRTAAATVSSAAAQEPLGVIYDKAKVDQAGNAVTGSGMNVRTHGIALVTVTGAVTLPHYIGTSTTAGQGTQVAPSAGTAPVLGKALTTATTAGDQVLVMLTPGNHV